MDCLKMIKMDGWRQWLTVAMVQTLVVTTSCGGHNRRAMTGSLQSSKSGWRPVVGSAGLYFGSLNTSPLHAPPAYRIPVPVVDTYQSSARPIATRDTIKLASGQTQRPRHQVVTAAPLPLAHQPINSYHYPFSQQQISHFKYFQNFPGENVIIKNPHNPYAARPIFSKYPNKINQPIHNNYQYQQLPNLQPVNFGSDLFGKPVDVYVRPDGNKKKQKVITEIYKPEVYKLPDSETAPQSVSQVKTAQQQSLATTKVPIHSYQQFVLPDLPPTILGSFGSYAVPSAQNREPGLTSAKSTYFPPSHSKQTVFNSFSYTPNYKSTPTIFSVTTPKLQTTANHINYGNTINDYKNLPTQQTKLSTPIKSDPNLVNKGFQFKASPQDPFAKHNVAVTTYNPNTQTTVPYNNYYYSIQHNKEQAVPNIYYGQHLNDAFDNRNKINNNLPVGINQQYEQHPNDVYDNRNKINNNLPAGINQQYEQHPNDVYDNRNKINDNLPAGINQQYSQYVDPSNQAYSSESTPVRSQSLRPTYEVTENNESDLISHSSPWTVPPVTTSSTQHSTEEPVTKQQPVETILTKPTTTTTVPELQEEYTFVTEPESGYENSLVYDSKVESQSRRPASEEFQPISGHKLKDYYYKVSTPSDDDVKVYRRTKKPTESSSLVTQELTTSYISRVTTPASVHLRPLPTVPPNKHFKRPGIQDTEKDKVRKRTKVRRRRPQLANDTQTREPTITTRKYQSTTELIETTVTEENYTIRPRIRPFKTKPPQPSTTPSTSTEITTSALPTVPPTAPTLVKKKLIHRRPITTTESVDTTTLVAKEIQNLKVDSRKESPIMKISHRPRDREPPKTVTTFEYNGNEIPDYSHKQDEKDTPTSDVSVQTDNLSNTISDSKPFLFHRDAKPIEAKLEPIRVITTTAATSSSEKNNVKTSTSRSETITENLEKSPKQQSKNKYENTRPRFSVKDYRNRMSSTTSSTEKPESQTPKPRYPHRKAPYSDVINTDLETTTERKKFTPKEPRLKQPVVSENETYDKNETTMKPTRSKTENDSVSTHKISARIRNINRRQKPTEEPIEISSPVTVKRVLRKKIKDPEAKETVEDVSVSDTTIAYEKKEDNADKTKSESAIMKIADKKHQESIEHLFEHTKRVSDLTLAASKDYNTPGMFKTVSTNSRRIPSYFTIATDDPILPIEAFFPQINQKKET